MSVALHHLACVALLGCAAPPLGLGSGATTTPGRGGVVGGTATIGAAANRQSFQVEAHGAGNVASWFAVEAGVVYSQLSDTREPKLLIAGGFPYVRPRLQLGPVSVATAVAGFGFGAGGGGLIGGIADVQLGYGTPSWSVYVGAYAHGFEVTSESPIETSARQQRIGGEYLWPLGTTKLGVAVEVHHQHDHLRDDGVMVHGDQWGGAVKVRIQSGRFR